jgi:uncharacterized membrane protein
MSEQSIDLSTAEAAAPATATAADPVVREITAADVNAAWAQGLRDFQAAPAYGLVFGGVYAAGGIAVTLLLSAAGLLYLVYPLAAGFTLLGPFVAIGLYEVSRRREAGLRLDWRGVFGVIIAQRSRQLAWMAFVLLFIFMIWLYEVLLFIAIFLGGRSFESFDAFLTVLATTPAGIAFLLAGNAVGALMALVVFSVTVVSFPLLLDRDVDVVTAMITSVRTVVLNPLPTIGWGFTIAVLLVLASLPFFLGFLVVLPVLGHASWHLYRKLVE